MLKIIALLRKKYQRGKTISEAAKDLEEDISKIQPLYDLIAQHSGEDDICILSMYREKG